MFKNLKTCKTITDLTGFLYFIYLTETGASFFLNRSRTAQVWCLLSKVLVIVFIHKLMFCNSKDSKKYARARSFVYKYNSETKN